MPHVILNGPTTVEDIWLAYAPLEVVEQGNRYKSEGAYLSADKKELLVRSLVIERGYRKTFFVRIHVREDGLLHIGLDALHQPDKSDGVKRLLGLYAWKIMLSEPEMAVTSTNIESFLKDPA
ncbi:hypothetical protein GC173_01810 [bacterium]|nr:hypothetical protein [bacterium]